MDNNINTFEQWFFVFVQECRKRGYSGELDQTEFTWKYELDIEPDEAAKSFMEEL